MKIFKSLESFGGGGTLSFLSILKLYRKPEIVYYGDMKHHYHKRFAFTLAEVLITLAIIGVVAALTIPSLISKHNEKVAIAELNKMYTNFLSSNSVIRS